VAGLAHARPCGPDADAVFWRMGRSVAAPRGEQTAWLGWEDSNSGIRSRAMYLRCRDNSRWFGQNGPLETIRVWAAALARRSSADHGGRQRPNSLCDQNSPGFPQIRATFQRDNLRQHFRVRVSHGQPRSRVSVGRKSAPAKLSPESDGDCSDAATIHVDMELSSSRNTAWPAAIRGSDHRRPCGRSRGVDKPTIGELVRRRMRPPYLIV
jgi:hypothetical protein